MQKINKLCLYGCAGIMLIGFASGAAACPTSDVSVDLVNLGSNKIYDNCTFHATTIVIGSNNSFKNASLNATGIIVEGENNNFTNAKLRANGLYDEYKVRNPDKYYSGPLSQDSNPLVLR